ncbi:hypothetical protein EZS27_032947, partial [termite gut metagenome]
MKTIYRVTGILSLITLFVITSCNESSFLEEKPLSIYSAENTLVTGSDFQAAVNYLHNRARNMIYNTDPDTKYCFWYATDLAFCAADVNKLNKYAATHIPTVTHVVNMWRNTYVIVNQANL